ncbi:MAG: ABC transporter substrate-binding protein [Silvanigrellaceae bacterium]|nr:ABC transporter substrate-binding protein [Silvanigrellaceae bacterium]
MNKKIFIIFTSLVTILCGIIFAKNLKKVGKNHHFTVGILQTGSFPQLDAARDGFIDTLKQALPDVEVMYQNAEGSLNNAQAIASSFKANKHIDAFYAIATPAIQSLHHAIKERPIVFAAVTDPTGLGLISPENAITGVTDMADIEKQIGILIQLFPTLQKVSILYSPSEVNSVILAKKMEKELIKHNVSYRLNGVGSIADVPAATRNAAQWSKLILIPTDHILTVTFPIVEQISSEKNIPIVTTWTGQKDGALLKFGVDYYESGVRAAQQMIEILVDNKNCASIPLKKPSSKIFIDADLAKKFNVTLSDELKKSVTFM